MKTWKGAVNVFDDMTYKISVEAQETLDKFIFSTIQPFCENKTQIVIEKQFLIDAIARQNPVEVIHGEGFALDSCPRCHHFITNEFQYCPRCGQKFIRECTEKNTADS